MMMDETLPLLHRDHRTAQHLPLNTIQKAAIATFSVVRLIRGLCFIAYPALGLSSFDIPQSGATFLLGSLLGSRDLLLGGLLWTADISSSSRRELRRALLVNLLSDVMDTCILIFSAACSWHWRHPFLEIGMAAVLAIAEHLTLWSISDEEEESSKVYAEALRRGDDKKRRMDTWLNEMRMAEAQEPTETRTIQEEQV